MASVFKKDGGWAYRVDIGIDPITGKRKQKYASGFPTQKKAQLAAAQVTIEVSGNSYVPDNMVTFEKFAEEWAVIYAESVKPSSLRVRLDQAKVLNRFMGKMKLQDITRRFYQKTISSLSAEGFAQNTLVGIHATARMIFRKAMEFDIITDNPTDFVKPPKKNISVNEALELEARYLEKHELVHFLNTIKEQNEYQYHELFLLMAYTGMRVGEICALTWQDVDFINKTISITKTIYNDNNTRNFKFGPPKTKKSIRTIAITNNVIAALNEYQKQQKIYRMRHANVYFDDYAMIFTSKKYPGYPMSRATAELKTKYYLGKAGLSLSLTPHTLRHTHVSLLAEAGVELYEIMDRLGHANDNTTRNIYLHVTKDKRRNSADKFTELLDGVSSK